MRWVSYYPASKPSPPEMANEMLNTLVDFHCHLDLFPDFESLMTECDRDGIQTLAVTTTPRAWPRNLELAKGTKNVRVALGLHPQLIAKKSHEFQLWSEYLPHTRYVGEVGLDATPQFYKSFDLQKQIFEKILKECASAGEKILTVHSLRAVPTVLDMLEAHLENGSCKIVLHWFTGSPYQARRAVEMGCYFSINAEMVKNKRHHDLLQVIPITRILTETDGPFTFRRGLPSRPRDVEDLLTTLSSIADIDADSLSRQIQNNLAELES